MWVEIPCDRLPDLVLFGYDKLEDGPNGFIWFHGPKGRMRVQKSKPIVWLDEISDVIEIGAVAIVCQ